MLDRELSRLAGEAALREEVPRSNSVRSTHEVLQRGPTHGGALTLDLSDRVGSPYVDASVSAASRHARVGMAVVAHPLGGPRLRFLPLGRHGAERSGLRRHR